MYNNTRFLASRRITYRADTFTVNIGAGVNKLTSKEEVIYFVFLKYNQMTYLLFITCPRENYDKVAKAKINMLLNNVQKLSGY